MTIETLMRSRAARDAQIEAVPLGQSIEETFQRRCRLAPS
jgi:hypothetical protein